MPWGVIIGSRWFGCMKTANVSLEIFLPASSGFLTTQCGVAYRWPPVWIIVDSPSWKASIFDGMAILTLSVNLF